jgi:hypothetical protein
MIWFLTLLALFSAPRLASAYCDPGVQRWINRDPLWSYPQILPAVSRMVPRASRVAGGLSDVLGEANLYELVRNDPVAHVDPLGLGVNDPPLCAPYPACLKDMPPRNPPKPPPYWYQCIKCSKYSCQQLAFSLYNQCKAGCFGSCLEDIGAIGPLGYALCLGDCAAGCAAKWAVHDVACNLCVDP